MFIPYCPTARWESSNQGEHVARSLQKTYAAPAISKAKDRAQDYAEEVGQAIWGPVEKEFGYGAPTNSQPGRLLNEWRTGTGPQERVFAPSSNLSKIFASAPSVRSDVSRSIDDWQSREGGWDRNGGKYTNYRARFGPIDYIQDAVARNPATHVVGSYRLDGDKQGDRINWKATNSMGRHSFFGGAWTENTILPRAPDVERPQRQGTTRQVIEFTTDLKGRVTD